MRKLLWAGALVVLALGACTPQQRRPAVVVGSRAWTAEDSTAARVAGIDLPAPGTTVEPVPTPVPAELAWVRGYQAAGDARTGGVSAGSFMLGFFLGPIGLAAGAASNEGAIPVDVWHAVVNEHGPEYANAFRDGYEARQGTRRRFAGVAGAAAGMAAASVVVLIWATSQ